MFFEVVAEGVELQAQLRCLQALGCGKIQRDLVSKPTLAAELERELDPGEAGACMVHHHNLLA